MSVGFLCTLVIKLRSLLEDSEIWVSRNANFCGPISQVNFKLGCTLLRKLKNIFTYSKELKTQKMSSTYIGKAKRHLATSVREHF